MAIMNAGTEGSGSGEAAGEGSDVGETKKARTCAQSAWTTKIKNRLQHSANKTNRSITVEFKGGKIQRKGKGTCLTFGWYIYVQCRKRVNLFVRTRSSILGSIACGRRRQTLGTGRVVTIIGHSASYSISIHVRLLQFYATIRGHTRFFQPCPILHTHTHTHTLAALHVACSL